MAKILVLHGPNLNLLGQRELNIYGKLTLSQLNEKLQNTASQLNHHLTIIQTNAEHELINHIQQSLPQKIDFIIINPAAYTHTSIALRDAFLSVGTPFIEVHLSNIQARESFRQHSYLADIAKGCIFGLGALSYELALQAAHHYLQN